MHELQPGPDDHVFTVEVEQWVSESKRVRRRKDAKTPGSEQALWRLVRRVSERAGIRALTPHQLRHGFANRFLRESGRDTTALQPLPGHSRLDTTQGYTDDVSLDDLHAVLETVARSRAAQRRQHRLRTATEPRRAPKTKSGGGGNRTRVRGRTERTSTSVVRASISPDGRGRTPYRRASLSFGCRASGDWRSVGS